MASNSLTFSLFGKDVSASKAFEGAGNAAEKAGGVFKNMASVAGGALAAIGVTASLGAVKDYLSDSVAAYKEAELSQVQLTDAYSRFPAMASVSIDALRNLNTELASKTRFDDDALASGQAVLSQFNLTGEQVSQITPLLADYAAKTGQDIPTSAEQLGKAMLGQGKALKAIGIDFVDAGSTGANFEQVMAGLSAQVGGFAEKDGAAGEGMTIRLNNQMGELQETIGSGLLPIIQKMQQAFLDNVVPVLATVAQYLADNVGPAFDGLSGIFDRVATVLASTFGPIIASLGPQILGLASAFSPLGLVLQVLLPVLPQLAALLSVIAEALAGALSQSLPVVSSLIGSLATILSESLASILPTIVELLTNVTTALSNSTPTVVALAGVVSDGLVASFQGTADVVSFLSPLIVGLSEFLADNTGLVIAAVAAYGAWKTVTGIMSAVSAATVFAKGVQLAYTTATYGAAGASYALGASSKAMAIGTVAAKVATVASTVAQGIATAAQWAWNAAMSANPIGLVVLAIAALVAGIIWVATQTTFFQDVWTAATDAIGTAWTWLWESVLKPVFDALGAAWDWLWGTIIKPVIDFIVGYFAVLGALFLVLWVYAVQPVMQWIGEAFTNLWNGVIQPVIDGIGAAFNWLWESIIMPVVGFIIAYVQMVGAAFTWLWTYGIQPALAAIGEAWNWLYNSVIVPVIGLIIAYVNSLAAAAMWLWTNAIQPAMSGIGAAVNWVWASVISPVFGAIAGAAGWIGNAFHNVFDSLASFVGDVFRNVGNFVAGGINSIIDLVNGAIGLINDLGKAASKVTGGAVTWNVGKIGHIPMLAQGGIVSSATLAMIGEGSEPEVVAPLSKLSSFIDDAARSKVDDGDGDGRGSFNLTLVTQNGASPQELWREAMWQANKAGYRFGGTPG